MQITQRPCHPACVCFLPRFSTTSIAQNANMDLLFSLSSRLRSRLVRQQAGACRALAGSSHDHYAIMRSWRDFSTCESNHGRRHGWPPATPGAQGHACNSEHNTRLQHRITRCIHVLPLVLCHWAKGRPLEWAPQNLQHHTHTEKDLIKRHDRRFAVPSMKLATLDPLSLHVHMYVHYVHVESWRAQGGRRVLSTPTSASSTPKPTASSVRRLLLTRLSTRRPLLERWMRSCYPFCVRTPRMHICTYMYTCVRLPCGCGLRHQCDANLPVTDDT